MRAFIAIEMPPVVTGELKGLQKRLQQSGVKARWVRPENIHLTLKFMGDIDPLKVETVSGAMRVAAGRFAPFELSVRGLGVFPQLKRARVLWAGLGGAVSDLIELQQELDAALENCGFEPEKRTFRGHLTLARFRQRVDPTGLQKALQDAGRVDTAKWTASSLVLFQSTLTPSGPIYAQLASHPLAG